MKFLKIISGIFFLLLSISIFTPHPVKSFSSEQGDRYGSKYLPQRKSHVLTQSAGLANEASGEKVVKQGEKPVFGGTYRRPLEFSPKTLDPALSIDTYAVTVIQQLFDGLVQFDKDLNVIPAIAKSWKISHDGLTYTFFLREGVKFHNGREVTGKMTLSIHLLSILDPEN